MHFMSMLPSRSHALVYTNIFLAFAACAADSKTLECFSSASIDVCVSTVTGELKQLTAGAGAVHSLGEGSGTLLAGCSLAPGFKPQVLKTDESLTVKRDLHCGTSFWNPRGGQNASVTDIFSAVDGAAQWSVEVSSLDAAAWTTAVQSIIRWEDFNDARLWVGGPTDDEPPVPGRDPLSPFEPPAGRLNYAHGGKYMFHDYPTPEADWTPGKFGGIPLALASRMNVGSDVGISWAQDATDAPPVAQLVVMRDAAPSPGPSPAPPTPGPTHNTSWFLAVDYNAVYGSPHDIHGKVHFQGFTTSWVACEAACTANSSCLIYTWSPSKACWWRLDKTWAANGTLKKESGKISGCFNGFTKDGQKVVSGCGWNPIPGPHPVPPSPGPAPPPPAGGPHLGLNYSRQYIRLGNGTAATVWKQYFYVHAADWRPALAFMVKRWPKHFLTDPSINLTAVAGPGSYADFRGGMDSATANKYQRMGYTLNWDASFPYPYHGLWLPYAPDYGPEWTTCFGHYAPDTHASGACYNTSYAKIRSYYEDMRRNGFRTCAYGNIFEYGSHIVEAQVAEKEKCESPFNDSKIAVDSFCARIPSNLPTCRQIHCKSQRIFQRKFGGRGSVLRNLKDGSMVYGGMGGAVVMDPGTKQYQDHLLNISKAIMQNTPCTGLCIDRQDWVGYLNFERDDGATWYEAPDAKAGGQPVAAMVYSWKQAMARMVDLWHSQPDQPLLLNTLTFRIDMMEFADGIFSEYGDAPYQQFLAGLLGLARPAIMWNHPGQSNLNPENIDAFLQGHIHFGVWPALPIQNNDHMIGPGSWDAVFELYGPLFTIYRGRKWVLEAHAVKVVNETAHINAFETPHGIVISLTFGPQKMDVNVRANIKISSVHFDQSIVAAEALRPDGSAPVPAKCELIGDGGDRSLACDVPLRRGCAMLLLPKSTGEVSLWI